MSSRSAWNCAGRLVRARRRSTSVDQRGCRSFRVALPSPSDSSGVWQAVPSSAARACALPSRFPRLSTADHPGILVPVRSRQSGPVPGTRNKRHLVSGNRYAASASISDSRTDNARPSAQPRRQRNRTADEDASFIGHRWLLCSIFRAMVSSAVVSKRWAFRLCCSQQEAYPDRGVFHRTRLDAHLPERKGCLLVANACNTGVCGRKSWFS